MNHVTLVMPAFNAARWIGMAVRSVRSQAYQDWDLLIMDDGSEDSTFESAIDAGCYDKRIKVLQQEHRGVTQTMADLWDLAVGPLLGQIDADDMLTPACLWNCADALSFNPDLDYVYTQHALIDTEGDVIQSIGKSRPLTRSKRNTRVVAHHFRLFRKSAYEQIGPIRRDLPAMPDFDLALRLQRECKGRFLDLPLYWHREHPDSLSAKHPEWQAEAAKMLGLVP